MPITVSEKWDSREGTTGDGASTDLRYIIRGTDDDTAARDALVANSPAFYNLLIRQSAHIARLGEDVWEGTVRYGTTSPSETGQSSFSFDTGGGSQHITQGRGTVARYAAPGKNAPNFGGAIGVSLYRLVTAPRTRARSETRPDRPLRVDSRAGDACGSRPGCRGDRDRGYRPVHTVADTRSDTG